MLSSLVLGCPSNEPSGEGDPGGSTTGGGEATTGSEGPAPTPQTTTSTTAGTTAADTTAGPSEDSSDTGDVPVEPGCPASLPGSWILCEDFDAPADLFTYFGHVSNPAGLIDVEETDAWSGTRALRIGHDPTVFGSGMADVRFGQGPEGGMIHAPTEDFREVWVRFYLRTDPAWPDAGIAEAVEVMSVIGSNRAIAVDATIYSPTQAEAQALAWSCVHDSELLCSGLGDWNNPNLEVRESGLGRSALYGQEAAGQWQCHEIHVRLDDPGMANGMFEVSVDGELEVSLQGIEFVDAWDGAGINTARFASFWNAPAVIDHHIDDVVVATEAIGCPMR